MLNRELNKTFRGFNFSNDSVTSSIALIFLYTFVFPHKFKRAGGGHFFFVPYFHFLNNYISLVKFLSVVVLVI